MADGIIRIALKRYGRIFPLHPFVKGIMQEEIGQQGTDNASLRCSLLWMEQCLICHHHRGFQQPFYIQKHPLDIRMQSDCSHQKIMINIIEKSFDIYIQYPVILPAILPGFADCIQGRFPWSIAIRIRMEMFFQFRLQLLLNYLLSDSVRHCRYSQRSHPTVSLGYFHPQYRRGEITARGHPIPQFVQVVL